MIIVDTNGKWVRSTALYPLQDPESGTRFESGVIYKVKVTEWLLGQPAIVEVPDPLASTEPVSPAVPTAPAKAPAAPVK